MKSIAITTLVSILLAPERSPAEAPCVSLKIQYILLLVGVVLLLLFSIYGAYRYKKQIQTLTSLLKQYGATSKPPLSRKKKTMDENNRRKAEESKNQYEMLNSFVVGQQLYLNPNLSRDDLAALIHLNKNHFAQMLQQNSGLKLADYLNDLRIEHAVLLLKENPDHTIQAIATDSGFNNMSTFYSLFKKRMEMTPSQYKSVLQETNPSQTDYQDYII